jgi:hypothetical protein
VDRERWRPFLKRWSEEWIAAQDPENDQPLDEGVARDRWLGFAPATAEEIAAAEARLGVSLPPSLREFLAVTNGWRDAGEFVYRLAGTAEIGWLRDLDQGWIDDWGGAFDEGQDEQSAETALLRRALQVSLDADASVMFLDPDEVDADGEWAGYWLASWSGEGPQWFRSFYDLMYAQYASFHSLRQPEGETRDQWDAKVEQARLESLDGYVDGPLEVLEKAEEFGRERATLLRFQMLAMLGHWHAVPLSDVVIRPSAGDELWSDPLFTAELLPLLFAEDRLENRGHGLFTLEHLMNSGPDEARLAIAEYQARLRDPGFRLSYGNPEFDAAVRHIAEGPADDAWPGLHDAIALWRPLSDNHIAPVVLFADPALAAIITEDRGREILSMRRGTE